MNYCNTDWETSTSTNNTEQMFIDEFIRLGLVQCISTSTHNKCNILDLILTNSDNYFGNIKILSDHEASKSDHYAINFDIKLRIERQKPLKRISILSVLTGISLISILITLTGPHF